jgi:hypothetical protein
MNAEEQRTERILAATKAAFPALWPKEEPEGSKASYAFARTDAIQVIAKAIDAYEAAGGGIAKPVLPLPVPCKAQRAARKVHR